jgi:hypothetical protein
LFDLFGETSVRPMGSITTRRLALDRPAESPLWAEIRTLCCRTGDNGGPIAKERWEFFAKLWVEPYERFLPEWTYVALFEESVVGYLTGCPDSRKFARTKAYPLLKELNFTATLFVYTDYLSAGSSAFSWADLKKLADEGFDVQAHSKSHGDMVRAAGEPANEYDRRLETELVQPRALFQKISVSNPTSWLILMGVKTMPWFAAPRSADMLRPLPCEGREAHPLSTCTGSTAARFTRR